MIAKTTVGSSFEGALTYGAGLRPGRKSTESELLGSSNLLEGTPQIMAKQMEEVAVGSTRIAKPVWHTSLSWSPGEMVTREQKLAAAEMYCELMGAPFERHQVAVYEHHDKPHEHIHIYINRVPVDGGPALRTSNNFYKQPKVCKQISQELGMQQLPQRRRSVQDIDPTKQPAREHIRGAIVELISQANGKNIDWFTAELSKRNINVRYTHDKQGILRGVSFETDGVGVKGQEVGYKGAYLREAFTAAQTQQQLVVPSVARAIKPATPTQKKRGPHL
jgi:hypothetical protein